MLVQEVKAPADSLAIDRELGGGFPGTEGDAETSGVRGEVESGMEAAKIEAMLLVERFGA